MTSVKHKVSNIPTTPNTVGKKLWFIIEQRQRYLGTFGAIFFMLLELIYI